MTAIARTAAKRMERTVSVMFDFTTGRSPATMTCVVLVCSIVGPTRRKMIKTISGIAGCTAVASRLPVGATSINTLCKTPIAIATPNAKGTLRSRATTAAASEVMTSPVKFDDPRPTMGASRTPASAARKQPIIHATASTGAVRVPCASATAGRSTTARIASPNRVPRRRNVINRATTAAPTRTINSLASRVIEPRR